MTWSFHKLKDVAIVGPKDPPLATEAPFVPMASVEVGVRRPLSYEPRGIRSGIRARANDVLFARITPCLENGKLAQLPADASPTGGSTEFLVVRPGPEIDPGFLYYWCASPAVRDRAEHEMTGTTGRMRFAGKDLKEFPIAIPPLEEQRRIVAIVEDLLSRLDVSEAGLEIGRRRLASLERSLATQCAFGDSSKTATLAEISTFITDGDHNPPKRVATGVPHVTAKGITSDGMIDLDVGTYVSEEGFQQTAKRYLPISGDVIVTCVGTIGRVAVVPEGLRFSADRNLAAVRLNRELARPEYVEIALRSAPVQKFMRGASGSTAQPHLYLRDLRRLRISLPSLAEQDAAVAKFNEAQGTLRRLKESVSLAQRRSAALRRSLLAAAFSGGLAGSSTGISADLEMTEV